MGARTPGARGARVRRHVLIVVFAACVLQLTVAGFGDHGMLAVRDARQSVAALRTEVNALRQQNQAAREECRRLREDPQAIEEIARRELGMLKPGEKVFILRSVPSK